MIARARVLASWALTPSAHAIRIEKPDGFAFDPVQFCGLEIPVDGGSQEYPMSLACAPTRPYLEFGARLSDSPWKRGFAALRAGDEVEVDGAYGHFRLDPDHDAVFVAGGIGVTPLKGMAEYLADTGSPRRAVLLYSNRSAEEVAYRSELEALAGKNPRFRVVHTLTRPPPSDDWPGRRGRIDAALLAATARELTDPTFYLCGRRDMVLDSGRALFALGVPRDRIVVEIFPGYG